MDDIYKGLSKEEKIEMVYDLTLQNTSGRETELQMYKLGIEACYEELCEGEPAHENSGLHLQNVMHCPEWLDKKDLDKAIAMYKERKIIGVKYLNNIAKQHLKEPLQWTTKFLRGCA